MTPRPLSAAAAAAVLATGACTLFDDAAPGGLTDAAGIVAFLNENHRLEDELGEAERRMVLDCMAEQGFTVHDPHELARWDVGRQEALVEHYPFSNFLLERDVAEEWGFGKWATSEQGMSSGAGAEYQAEFESEFVEHEDAYAEFNRLEPEVLLGWYVAFMGEEWAVQRVGAEFAGRYMDLGGLDEASSADGFGLDPGAKVAPAPGGCVLEMIETLYGEPRPIPFAGQPDAFDWTWGPENPEDGADRAAMLEEYRAAVAEEEAAMVDCLAEGGRDGWVFTDEGSLPVGRHLLPLYYPGIDWVGVDGEEIAPPELPDPPEDFPSDLEGRKAFEIDLALAFVDCGDSTGYREAATAAYDRIQVEFYASAETEFFAYQEALRDALAHAQEVIGG